VVLIGPAAAGKSVVGALLSQSLNIPHVDLDKVGDAYYEAAGFPLEELDRRMFENYLDAYRWACAALPYALERVVADHKDCVFSVAAIHTHYEEPEYFERARAALAPFDNVVLLLPCPDLDRSVDVLRARSVAERRMDWIYDGHDFYQRWVKDSCNAELATMTVYTDGKTPEQTRDEILSITGTLTAASR
jgi:hypothetical protein